MKIAGFKKGLAIFVLAFSSITTYAQEDEPVDDPKPVEEKKEIIVIPKFKPSIRGFFKLPNTIANNTFKKVFNGVSNIEVSYMQPFAKNFFVTGGFQHGYFDVNQFSFPELSNGKMQSFMGVGEIGYQKYWNDKWYYIASLRAGYGLVAIKTANCSNEGTVPQQAMAFGEGLFGIYLHGNDRMSYGLVISYQLYNFEFGPEWICRDNFSGLTEIDYQGLSQNITVGFGFTCILGKMLE
jgi:hypothetical protein